MGFSGQYGAGLTILFAMEDHPQVHAQDFEDFLGDKRWVEIEKSLEGEARQILIGKKRESDMIRQKLEESWRWLK